MFSTWRPHDRTADARWRRGRRLLRDVGRRWHPSAESAGHDLLGVTSGCSLAGAQTGILTGDPMLAALADNGGPTRTHAPLAGSPLLDAGRPGGALSADGSILAADQRGLPQPNGTGGAMLADIGAVEAQ